MIIMTHTVFTYMYMCLLWSYVCLLFGVTADVMAVAAFLAAPRTGGASTDSGDGTGAAAAGAAFFARAGVEAAAAFLAGGCSSFSSAGSAFCFRFLLKINVRCESVSPAVGPSIKNAQKYLRFWTPLPVCRILD